MLPAPYVSSYQCYKSDTSVYLNWLVDTARKCGLSEAVTGTPRGRSKHSKEKQDVPQVDLIACAEGIVRAVQRKNAVEVPSWVLRAGRQTIALRKKFSVWYTAQAQADVGHDYFIVLLEKTQSILVSLSSNGNVAKESPKANAPPRQPLQDKSLNRLASKDVSNPFCLLKVENIKVKVKPSVDNDSTPRVKPAVTVAAGTTTPTMDTSGAATDEGLIFAIFCFLDDLHKLENHILDLWRAYHSGRVDLVTASITTNTSFELATQLTTELELEYPNLGGWRGMINILYAGNGKTTGHFLETVGESMEWVFLDAAVALHAALVLERIDVYLPRAASKAEMAAKLKEQYYAPGRFMPQAMVLQTSRGVRPAWNQSLAENKGNIRGVIGHYLKNLMKTRKISKTLPVENHFMKRVGQLHDKWDPSGELDLDVVFMGNLMHGISRVPAQSTQRPAAQLLKTIEQTVLSIAEEIAARSVQACTCPRCADKACDGVFKAMTQVDAVDALSKLPILQSDLAGGHGPDVFYPILFSDPVLCGLLMLRYDMLLSQIGLYVCNTTESTMGIAHLYNACMVTGDLTKAEEWADLEHMIGLCREDRVFLGSRPTDPVTFRNRYILTAGISLRAFSHNKHDGFGEHAHSKKKSHWVGSEQRRRKLAIDAPLAQHFHHQASGQPSGTFSCICSAAQDIINPKATSGNKGQRENNSPKEYCERVAKVISAEIPRTMFPVLMIHDRCHALLKELYYDFLVPLKEDGVDISTVGCHASIIYDILFAANYACPGCHTASGNESILPTAASTFRLLWDEIGKDDAIVTADVVFRERYGRGLPAVRKAVEQSHDV